MNYTTRENVLFCANTTCFTNMCLHYTLQENFEPPLFREIESAHEKTEKQIKTIPLAAERPWEQYFWRIFLRPDIFLICVVKNY